MKYGNVGTKMNKIMNGKCSLDNKYFTVEMIYKGKCPNCNAEISHNFEEDHIEYVEFDEIIDLYISCENCEADVIIPIIVHPAKVDIEFFEEQMRIERYDNSE